MKRRLTQLSAALLLGLAACTGNNPKPVDDGPQTTQDRQVAGPGATGIRIEAPLNLHIRIGNEPSLRMKGPSRILGRLKTEMDGQTLHIYTEGKLTWNSHETAEAWVTIPHLRMLHTAGAGDIAIDSRLEEPAVDFDLGGAVNIDVSDIDAQELNLNLSGAGNILIRNGRIDKGNYSITGTGNIDAFDLKTREAAVSVTGAGRAALTAVDKLDATISGAGMIRYKGNPAIEKSISGIGTLQNANQ